MAWYAADQTWYRSWSHLPAGYQVLEALKASVQGEDGRNQILTMGCYGIGVTRVVAAAIEQNYDERGIVWPDAIAPFGGDSADEHAQILPRTRAC